HQAKFTEGLAVLATVGRREVVLGIIVIVLLALFFFFLALFFIRVATFEAAKAGIKVLEPVLHNLSELGKSCVFRLTLFLLLALCLLITATTVLAACRQMHVHVRVLLVIVSLLRRRGVLGLLLDFLELLFVTGVVRPLKEAHDASTLH